MRQDTLAADRPPRRVERVRTIVTGAAVFAASFLYRFPDAADLVNDHFMHVAWGRQLLWGRLPLRDAVSLGMPLQTALSAAAEWLVGYRLLSEALIISTAFAAAAVMTFVVVKRATASIAIAVLAAVFEVAIAPRTYSYPKVLVYSAGLLLLWRYIDRPSNRRAIELGLATAVAFYLRHDHGLYLGVVALAVIAMRHGRLLRATVQQVAVYGAVCVLAVAPYVVYVQVFGGLTEYVKDLRQFAAREHSQNKFEWPAWPLPSMRSMARRTSPDERGASIAIRWNPNASDDVRRQALQRYHLQIPTTTGPIPSGRFQLSDVSRENATALIKDPAIEDTAGIDRVTGEIRIPGWYVGPIRVLEGLDVASASAALLFFVFLSLSVITAIVLARGGPAGSALDPGRIKIASVLLVAVVTFIGFIRESLAVRIGDAIVAPVVLGAWLSARWLAASRPWSRSAIARAVVLALVLIPVTRSVVVAGGVDAVVHPVEPYSRIWHQLSTSPPFAAWPAGGSARYRVVRYVRECTRPDEPLLLLWFAPELLYYADRPFAGRIGAYMKGYFTSEYNQRTNIAALERDRPAVAIIEAGREQTDLVTHPSMITYLADHYHVLGEVPATDGTTLRVYGRNDRASVSTYADLGWPCYR